MRVQISRTGALTHLGQPLLLPSGWCLYCHGLSSASFGYIGRCPVCHSISDLQSEIEDRDDEIEDLKKEIEYLNNEIAEIKDKLEDTNGVKDRSLNFGN